MGNTYILKLGGSIITDKKGGRPILRTRRIKEIAREIVRAQSKRENPRLILLHGGGSFGHPLAYRYRLVDQPLSTCDVAGIGYTISAMRELGTRLATLFLDAGIPVVPLQTSSCACVRHGRVHFTDFPMIETVLKNGGVPLLGGDVVFSDHARTAIVSADRLAVEFARKLKKTRLLFATDTDGVYAAFPFRKNEKPLPMLDRTAVKNFIKTQKPKNTGTDVTGAMPGKLHALLDARGTTAMIFNGNAPGSIAGALLGKRRGTYMVL